MPKFYLGIILAQMPELANTAFAYLCKGLFLKKQDMLLIKSTMIDVINKVSACDISSIAI